MIEQKLLEIISEMEKQILNACENIKDLTRRVDAITPLIKNGKWKKFPFTEFFKRNKDTYIFKKDLVVNSVFFSKGDVINKGIIAGGINFSIYEDYFLAVRKEGKKNILVGFSR